MKVWGDFDLNSIDYLHFLIKCVRYYKSLTPRYGYNHSMANYLISDIENYIEDDDVFYHQRNIAKSHLNNYKNFCHKKIIEQMEANSKLIDQHRANNSSN